MLRAIIFTVILLSALATKAQYPLFPGAQNSAHSTRSDTDHLQNKWFVTKYAGISTGFIAFKGGSGSFLTAPLALQVNRQLSNNVYGFGGVSLTPFLFQSNNLFYQPAAGKSYGMMRANNFGISPAAQIGVMYINNDKTFSISGSISVSSNTYTNYGPATHVQ